MQKNEIIFTPDTRTVKQILDDEIALQKKIFVTSPEEIFGYLLYLFRKNLDLTQEQMGAVLKFGDESSSYSKTGYAKLERAETGINLQVIFDLSFLTDLPYYWIFKIYTILIEAINSNPNITIQFHEMCGQHALGNAYSKLMMDNEKKELYKIRYSTKYKEYPEAIGQTYIDEVNKIINTNIPKEKKEMIKFRAECIINTKKYKK